jgi:hypothetical protein
MRRSLAPSQLSSSSGSTTANNSTTTNNNNSSIAGGSSIRSISSSQQFLSSQQSNISFKSTISNEKFKSPLLISPALTINSTTTPKLVVVQKLPLTPIPSSTYNNRKRDITSASTTTFIENIKPPPSVIPICTSSSSTAAIRLPPRPIVRQDISTEDEVSQPVFSPRPTSSSITTTNTPFLLPPIFSPVTSPSLVLPTTNNNNNNISSSENNVNNSSNKRTRKDSEESLSNHHPTNKEEEIPSSTITTEPSPTSVTIILTRLSTTEREKLDSIRRRPTSSSSSSSNSNTDFHPELETFLQLGCDNNLLDGKRRVLTSILANHNSATTNNKIIIVIPNHHREMMQILQTICLEELNMPHLIEKCQIVTNYDCNNNTNNIIIYLAYRNSTTSPFTTSSLLQHLNKTTKSTIYILLASDTTESNEIWPSELLEERKARHKWSEKEYKEYFNNEVWPDLHDEDGWTSSAAGGSSLSSYVFTKPGIKRKSDRIRNHNTFYSEKDLCEWYCRRNDECISSLVDLGFKKIQDVTLIPFCTATTNISSNDLIKLWERIEVCWML